LDWKFGQVFGDKTAVEDVADVDIVSAIEFDQSGDFLAAGDRGGRVVLFEREKSKDKGTHFKFYYEFQSHEPEFDYLKSLEIEEKINKIRWFPRRWAHSHLLLTTNGMSLSSFSSFVPHIPVPDKTVKLWKVFEKQVKFVDRDLVPGGLSVPKVTDSQNLLLSTPKKVFGNAHAYHINSVSLNCDGETFLSADDLRVNLWNLDNNVQSFNVVDIKPPNMEELTEVITAAEFHPSHCHLMMYSSSKGTIKLNDLRESALCDTSGMAFEQGEDPDSKSFFSEIISSVSDIKFIQNGELILSRDYLTLKVWDLKMNNKPLQIIDIHDYLRPKLCDLYENDCIFDKFECHASGDGNHLITGSYQNYFNIYNRTTGSGTSIEALKAIRTAKKVSTKDNDLINPDLLDYNKKCLHVSWNPAIDVVAIAASNNLYLYNAV
jgi:serine/threonine-protein phosphatase 2A regulatory subunit B